MLRWFGPCAVAVLITIAPTIGRGAGAPEGQCAVHVPWGKPANTGTVDGTIICRPHAYMLQHDNKAHEPRWVAYHLTAAQSFGCIDRTDNFHQDELLPDTGARPADYAGSGYDQGHMKPAQDSAWHADVMSDSFSMANMTPQLAGINRKEWERGEEYVRAWAWKRGELVIIAGPTLPAHARRIGHDGVLVPGAFFKVVVDPVKREAIAWIMPQHEEPKGPIDPWLVSIADVESQAGIQIPLPKGVSKSARAKTWPADLKGWAAEHKKRCA